MPFKFGKGTEHLDDAAAAGLMALGRQPRVGEQEFVAAIARDPKTGQFFRTSFKTSGDAGKAPAGSVLRELLDAGLEPAALIHNHPGGVDTAFAPQFLSQADSALGSGQRAFKDGTQIPAMEMFLLAATSQGVQDLRKGTGRTERVARPRPGSKREMVGLDLESTEPFLAEFPIEEFLAFSAQRNPLTRALLQQRGQPLQFAGEFSRPRPQQQNPLPRPELAQRESPIAGRR